MSEYLLQLKGITKKFGTTPVLKNINIDISKGEFVTLLGSSGCGKTTTLRIIAGLEQADTGEVILNNENITDVEPNKRDVNTVFQSYALFPHMTVANNIGYSLKIKKKNKDEIKKSVSKALDLVQLEGYGERFPSELSGGQKQRVAIARAIVNNPSVMLLDEPLGALDLQLRRQMQLELKRLQKQLGITFIYITHDQEEALNMSDRICVMKDGSFLQMGTPTEIYEYPRTDYVAKFVGEANIVHGKVKKIMDNGMILACVADGEVMTKSNSFVYKINDNISIAIRKEHIEIGCNDSNCKGLMATLKEKSFAGGMLRIVLTLQNGEEIIANRLGMDTNLEVGNAIHIFWNAENAVAVMSEEATI